MKNFDKRKVVSCLMYLDVNKLYGWAMSQNFHINNFKWIEDLLKFNETFIKNYDEHSEVK